MVPTPQLVCSTDRYQEQGERGSEGTQYFEAIGNVFNYETRVQSFEIESLIEGERSSIYTHCPDIIILLYMDASSYGYTHRLRAQSNTTAYTGRGENELEFWFDITIDIIVMCRHQCQTHRR